VDGNNLSLSYRRSGNSRCILTNGAVSNVSYQGGGDIQVQGRRVTLTSSSQIGAGAFKKGQGGTLTVRGLRVCAWQVEPQQMVGMPAACLLRLKVPELPET